MLVAEVGGAVASEEGLGVQAAGLPVQELVEVVTLFGRGHSQLVFLFEVLGTGADDGLFEVGFLFKAFALVFFFLPMVFLS